MKLLLSIKLKIRDASIINFKQRVENFWQWFKNNQGRPQEYVGDIKANSHDPQEVVDFLSQGGNLAIDNIEFEIRGNTEINLAPKAAQPFIFLPPAWWTAGNKAHQERQGPLEELQVVLK